MKRRWCTRRGLLGGLLATPFAHCAEAGPADHFPSRVVLVVAGPASGALDRAASSLAAGLQSHFPTGTLLARTPVGGLDGVTGANQFASQTSLDGGAALLVPGDASLAWLAGDSRVHFDPSRWLPILARTSSATILVRDDGVAMRSGAVIRVASGGPVSPALAAMLAIDLLGWVVEPVYGLGEEQAALAALRSGRVDAMLTRQADAGETRTPFPGVRALCSCSAPRTGGERDPLTPQVPTLLEYNAALGRQPLSGPRYDAWCCAASASGLRYALVLPSLTPPAAVALWRAAGARALTPGDAGSAMQYAAGAAALLRSSIPGGAALLDLRGWLAERLGWQPG